MRRFTVRLFLLTALATADRVNAATITLISSGAGVYTYGVTLNAGETIQFNQNQQITFSGMSGVTGESVISGQFSSCGFTASTACFAVPPLRGFGTAGSFTLGTIDSSVLTTGAITYQIQTASGTWGPAQVTGPVAASTTPEPASVSLLLAGAAVLVWFRRRGPIGPA